MGTVAIIGWGGARVYGDRGDVVWACCSEKWLEIVGATAERPRSAEEKYGHGGGPLYVVRVDA